MANKKNPMIVLSAILLILGVLYIFWVNFIFAKAISKEYKLVVSVENHEVQHANCENKSLLKSLNDSIRTLKQELAFVKKDLEKVEEINDKRFELLGWGLALVITVILVFLSLNYLALKSQIRDAVYEQMDDKFDDYKERYDKVIANVEILNDKLIERLK